MSSPSRIEYVCPTCGALNRFNKPGCFLCGESLAHAEVRATPVEPAPPPAPDVPIGATSRLSSWMLAIALIAVCLGVYQEAPGLGVPLAIVATVAFSRTARYSMKGRGAGRPLSVGDKLAVFSATVGVAVLVFACIGIALFSALLIICTGGRDPGGGVSATLVVCAVLIVATFWLARALSRVRPGRGDR